MSSDPQLRTKAALETVRSVLFGLVLVALLGSIAALVTYRADVLETREQVRQRVSQQGRLYADSLGLYFEVMRSELQRVADRGFESLSHRDDSVLEASREDVSLFNGGVALFDGRGQLVWSEPAQDLGPNLSAESWFQHVLREGKPTVDELRDDDTERIAVAVPVREQGTLEGVLVGIVRGTDRLSLGMQGPREQLLLLSSQRRVISPLVEPEWSRTPDFDARVEALRGHESADTWTFEGHEVMADGFPVKNTALHVLAIESEGTSIAPIRRRLNAQLVFLLVVQVGALGAFLLFLRRTWRAFLDAERRVVEQEKLAALGGAAGLIAHEVKNSLNGLKAASSLLDVGGDAVLARRTIGGQVDRLGHLASSLLSFARPAERKGVPVQLDVLVRETVQGLSTLPEFPEAQVELELGTLPTLESDPLLLTTALDNLVRNAVEAAVEAKDLGRTTAPRVKVRAFRDGDVVRVRVEDNAGGPPDGFEARLGQPFFTTKSRGIGLGLAMAQRAAQQLGGRLHFERIAGGSGFELELPVLAPGDT